jgi:hypothetical protein
LVEETGVPGENHWPVTIHGQTLSHKVVSSTPRHEHAGKYWNIYLTKTQKLFQNRRNSRFCCSWDHIWICKVPLWPYVSNPRLCSLHGHYVIKFVSDLRQVSGFLRVLIIIFSYHRVSKNLDFYLNGKSVLITTSHKHLGVTFINDVECPYW